MRNKFSLVFLALFLSFAIFSCAFASFSYDIDDYIPLSDQEQALQFFIEDSGIIGTQPSSASYLYLVEQYLRVYGIYFPDTASSYEWIQTSLKGTERFVLIPERYKSESELHEWLTRYATPGDLLCYKANGKPDRCLVYAGNGLCVGVKYGREYNLIKPPATFVSTENFRTPASGLYAIAHIYSSEEQSVEGVQLTFVTDLPDSENFSGITFTLWEQDAYTKEYNRMNDHIIYEKSPGVFSLWDGSSEMLSDSYIEFHNGIHLLLIENSTDANGITNKTRIDISPEQITGNTLAVPIAVVEHTNNVFQWNGADLLYTISSQAEASSDE